MPEGNIQEPLLDASSGDRPEKPDKWAEPDVLSRQQINQCLMDIEDIHPLQYKTRGQFWRFVVPCICCKREGKPAPDFTAALRMSMLREMDIKRPESEDDLLEDPFLYLGYGVNSYFRVMLSFFWMFVMVTLFYIPVFMALSSYSAKSLFGLPGYGINQFSLGNIGGSTVQCGQAIISAKTLNLQCPKGTELECSKLIFGVIPKGVMSKDYCQKSALITDPDNMKLNKATNKSTYNHVDCTAKLAKPFVQQLKAQCLVQTKTNKLQYKIDLSIPKSGYNKSITLYPFIYQMSSKEKAQCSRSDTFFAQAPCIVPKAVTHTKAVIGLITSCLAIFVYFFFILFLDYIDSIEENLYIDTDIKTVTAGDYTIEFDLCSEQYEKFKSHYYQASNPISEMAQFKLFIQDEIEDRINRMDNLGYDGDDVEYLLSKNSNEKKIAQITFAFNNAQVIEWLEYRGYAIQNEDWDEVVRLNGEIAEGLKQEAQEGEDMSLLDQLQTPVSVFATFETEEGYRRACLFQEVIEDLDQGETKNGMVCVEDKYLLGYEIELQEASEPSDIIWENRHISQWIRFRRRVTAWVIIVIMLSISAATIFYMSTKSNQLKLRYPYTDCVATTHNYIKYKMQNGKDSSPPFNKAQWQQQSIKEELFNQHLKNIKKPTQYGYIMQCFCKYESAQLDSKGKMKNPYNKKYTYKDNKGATKTIKLCEKYYADFQYSFGLGMAISMVIVAFNLVLRFIIIALIEWIGEDTYSERLSSITNAVFMATFFNTGILLLLVNANVTEHPPIFLTKYLKGQWYDYVPGWYTTVGYQIVFTMVINIFMPFSALTMGYMLPKINRVLDVGFSDNPYDTKKTGMSQFKIAWSGMDYIVHFKFANVLNVYFVTLMYGVGLPILFPLAALNFLNQWWTERVIVTYWMKMPPSLDNKLIKNLIEVCKWGPILYLVNGYWMLSNVQMFNNKWKYKDTRAVQMKSEHYITIQINHATPMLQMVIFSFIIIILQKVLSKELQKTLGWGMSEKDIDVDEDLPNFFRSIKLSQADEIVMEMENMKDNFGFEHMDPDTVDILDATQMPVKAIQGTPWYQVISNLDYQFKFAYIPACVGEREKLIEDGWEPEMEKDEEGNEEMTEYWRKVRFEQSDLVMILLNLSYIPDKVIEQLDFKKGWNFMFKQYMDQYKVHFKETHGEDWAFQSEDLEQEYLAYKKQQRKIDTCEWESAKLTQIEEMRNKRFKSFTDDTMAQIN